jgi:hypothetical protein
MEAYRIDRFGSVDGIVLRSSEDPRPGPKEILMRVRASSLNYQDLMVLKGGGRGPTKLGVVPLSDGAGEVAAIGDGVTGVKRGNRVIGTFHPRWFGGPLSADYLTDRLGANLGDAGRIRGAERGSGRACAKPPLESQVRTGLRAGGRWFRTLGPPWQGEDKPREIRSSGRQPAPKHTSGGIRPPIA